MLEWVTKNPDAAAAIAAIITTIATVILVIITAVYVYYTNKSVKEAKKLREITNSPLISIYIQSFKKSNHLELVVENIGNSPAYNVNIVFDDKFVQKVHESIPAFPSDLHIHYFSPNQSVTYRLCEFSKLPQDNDYSFDIKLSYNAIDRQIFDDKLKYNYSFLKSSLNSMPYELEQLKDMLKGIENSIKSLTATLNNKDNNK